MFLGWACDENDFGVSVVLACWAVARWKLEWAFSSASPYQTLLLPLRHPLLYSAELCGRPHRARVSRRWASCSGEWGPPQPHPRADDTILAERPPREGDEVRSPSLVPHWRNLL
jgi:hypothetical protein